MSKELKEKLKKEGRSLRWFHTNFFGAQGLTYNAMALQLNGYVALSQPLKKAIVKYLEI